LRLQGALSEPLQLRALMQRTLGQATTPAAPFFAWTSRTALTARFRLQFEGALEDYQAMAQLHPAHEPLAQIVREVQDQIAHSKGEL
jgi:hypothetical protein